MTPIQAAIYEGDQLVLVRCYRAEDVEQVLKDAKCLANWVRDLGYQTESTDLNLTTAEFTEMWKLANCLLAHPAWEEGNG